MSTWNEPASLFFVFSNLFRLCRMMALQENVDEFVASQESAKDRIIMRKESLSNRLIVKKWSVESTGGHQDTLAPPGETDEAPQPRTLPINSLPASCAMRSDDCDSSAGEEEMVDCAICLSSFRPQQLVCESNNASCRHVFHKDCMVDWLMKLHDNCPMCRENYVLQATV
jgi:hypothetical protein